MSTASKIMAMRQKRGWSRPQLAARMGTSPQQIEKLEKGARRLTTDWLEKFADAFEVEIAALFDLAPGGSQGPSGDDPPNLQENAVAFRFEGSGADRPRDDLQVYGTALGASRIVENEAIEQTMLNTGEVVVYLKRPPILNGRDDVYGLYVQGSSMSPVYNEGAMLIAERRRPPAIGDDVVVYLRDQIDDEGARARAVLIKRLVRRTANYTELEQFHPASVFKIAADDILRMDRVMTLSDLLS